MSWEFLTQLLIFASSVAAMVTVVLKYYFKKVDQTERDKIKAREKIKTLEGQLAEVMMNQIRAEVDALKVALTDLKDSNQDIMIQYEKLVKRIEHVSVKLDSTIEEHELFVEAVKQKINKEFGKVIFK